MSREDLERLMVVVSVEAVISNMRPEGHAALNVLHDEIRKRLRAEAARERASSQEDAR